VFENMLHPSPVGDAGEGVSFGQLAQLVVGRLEVVVGSLQTLGGLAEIGHRCGQFPGFLRDALLEEFGPAAEGENAGDGSHRRPRQYREDGAVPGGPGPIPRRPYVEDVLRRFAGDAVDPHRTHLETVSALAQRGVLTKGVGRGSGP
jgi:hypothetical protein